MAQVPNDLVPPQEGDMVQLVLGKLAELRARLLKLRGSSQKEYDRVLKQGFPLDVLALLEVVTLDYGNRTAALAYRLDELSLAVLPEDDGEGDDESDAEGDAEIAAARVLVEYLEKLPDLPANVSEAVALLRAGDLFAADDDEPEDDNEDEPEPEDGDKPEAGSVVAEPVKPEGAPAVEEEPNAAIVDEASGVASPGTAE